MRPIRRLKSLLLNFCRLLGWACELMPNGWQRWLFLPGCFYVCRRGAMYSGGWLCGWQDWQQPSPSPLRSLISVSTISTELLSVRSSSVFSKTNNGNCENASVGLAGISVSDQFDHIDCVPPGYRLVCFPSTGRGFSSEHDENNSGDFGWNCFDGRNDSQQFWDFSVKTAEL